MRDQKTQEERKRSDMENESMENHRRMVVDMERQREVEKKQRLRETQEANRLAAMAKKSTSLEKKVSGDMQDRDTIQDNIYKYQPNVF
jgi:adenylate kinase